MPTWCHPGGARAKHYRTGETWPAHWCRYGILSAMTIGRTRSDVPVRTARIAASKVPIVTAYFWIIKILSTGMGETTSDYLAHRLGPYVAVGIGGVGLAVALPLQFAVRRYLTWVYWLAVVMVSVFGTMVADAAHIVLGVPYLVSTVVFIVVLAAIFAAWYSSERTLSIHSIFTRRRELFYWATVVVTFALGTAAGDLTARTFGLGFLTSGILFALVFTVPAVSYWRLGMNPILAFWLAYIVTRPLGASFADWLSIPGRVGGLGFGFGPVSVVLTIMIIGLVGYLAVTRKDVQVNTGPRARKRGRHRLQSA
jgi:uncharacterized membrane-anchored protein